MPKTQSTKLQQTFHQQLLLATQKLGPNKPMLDSSVLIQPLATLTKLIVRQRQTVRSLQVPHPLVVAILAGKKTLHIGGQTMIFEAGDLFVFPSHLTANVINQPAPAGEYMALVLELSTQLLNRVRQAYPEIIAFSSTDFAAEKSLNTSLSIALSLPLANALIHLIQGTIYSPDQTFMLNEHHLMEVVLLLLQSNVRMLLSQAIYPDFLTHIRSLIRADLSANWSLERLAQTLDMSVSTLKRRLQGVNLSYRQLLDEERMSKAMELLTQPHQSIAQVALACGYESQSRFAARFRKYYSLNPSEVCFRQEKFTGADSDPSKS